MGTFLIILIFIGFVFLMISLNQDKDLSESSVGESKPSSNLDSYESLQEGSCDDLVSSSPTKTQDKNVAEVNWDLSIFQHEFFSNHAGLLYQQGMQIYQASPEQAAQYFEQAFQSLQKLAHRYSQNPFLYFNMLECAMGFDYDIAIISGYKFFELVEYGNFSYEQLGTTQLGAMYDMSRKMYKLLLIKGRFEDAKRFAGKTVYISNSILRETHNEMLEIERDIATFFYVNLSEGNYSVQQIVVSGFDGPEPWYRFDMYNNPEMMKKIKSWGLFRIPD